MMNRRFTDQTIPFMLEAGQQTDPGWLDRHQQTYDEIVRLPFLELAQTLKSELQDTVPDYHFPTRGIGRIKRAANKVVSGEACYKDWLSLSAAKPSASRFERNPHLFLGILPGIAPYMGVILAGGLFMPTSAQLKRVRQAIARDAEPFHTLFSDPTFASLFSKGFELENMAARMPRGFDPEHSDEQWLRLKTFLVVKRVSSDVFTSPEFAMWVVQHYRQLARLNRLLEAALDRP